MAKRTLTKKGRTFQAEIKEGKVNITRKDHIDPPEGKTPITFTYAGVEITEYVAPGQVINKKRAYKRWLQTHHA